LPLSAWRAIGYRPITTRLLFNRNHTNKWISDVIVLDAVHRPCNSGPRTHFISTGWYVLQSIIELPRILRKIGIELIGEPDMRPARGSVEFIHSKAFVRNRISASIELPPSGGSLDRTKSPGASLPKMGIFAHWAGDFRHLGASEQGNWTPETGG
jgi:hypothetical protein